MDADRQEPGRTLPPGSGLGALPGATRSRAWNGGIARMYDQSVPSLFSVRFPACSQSRPRVLNAVPSVPRLRSIHVRIAYNRCQILNQPGTGEQWEHANGVNELAVERSRNGVGNSHLPKHMVLRAV